MKNIEFLITDHGFGHASRNIPLIRYILKRNEDIKIIIKTGKAQGEFISSNLEEFKDRIEYYFSPMDVGLILKEGSLDVDKEALDKKVREYIKSWDEKIEEERSFLKENNINLVVSDIVPWVFKAASLENVKAMLISNFTWVDMYKKFLKDDIVKEYKECYKKATKVLLYDLYMEGMKEYLTNYEEVGLCCRDFNLETIEKIKKINNKKKVFISVGRSVDLENVIDVSSLDYYFIATKGINLKGNNVKYLDIETKNTHEYLIACDYVITKAGWGTLAECLIGKKKIGVLKRDKVPEDKNSIDILKKRNEALEISLENFDLKDILKKLEEFTPNYKEYFYTNEYKTIAEKIVDYI